MKKRYLFFILMMSLVMVGCGKQPLDNSVKNGDNDSAQMNQEGGDQLMPGGAGEELPAIETEVKDIKEYDSPDELLEDIDSAMDDLDNL